MCALVVEPGLIDGREARVVRTVHRELREVRGLLELLEDVRVGSLGAPAAVRGGRGELLARVAAVGRALAGALIGAESAADLVWGVPGRGKREV